MEQSKVFFINVLQDKFFDINNKLVEYIKEQIRNGKEIKYSETPYGPMRDEFLEFIDKYFGIKVDDNGILYYGDNSKDDT